MSIVKGTPLTQMEHKFLRELVARGSRFMVVGMSAADLQGANIGTQDIDLWFGSTSDGKLDRAARSVGCLFLWRADPPTLEGEALERIDVVNQCDGLESFDNEYASSVETNIEGIRVRVLPLERIIISKKAANRPKDRAALPSLRAVLAAFKHVEIKKG